MLPLRSLLFGVAYHYLIPLTAKRGSAKGHFDPFANLPNCQLTLYLIFEEIGALQSLLTSW
jgi:hypothetical protein